MQFEGFGYVWSPRSCWPRVLRRTDRTCHRPDPPKLMFFCRTVHSPLLYHLDSRTVRRVAVNTRLVPYTVAVSDYLVSWVVSKSLNTYSALSLDGNLFFNGFIYHGWPIWSDYSLHSTVCYTRDHSA